MSLPPSFNSDPMLTIGAPGGQQQVLPDNPPVEDAPAQVLGDQTVTDGLEVKDAANVTPDVVVIDNASVPDQTTLDTIQQ
jgi:hypothetical protein